MARPVHLVHVVRGGRVESVHRGAFVLVKDGEVLAHAGEPTRRSYYRSTAKPFQSMVAVTTGAADRFGLTPEMLAIGAGSHNSAPHHLSVVRAMLAKAGLGEGALGCGGHWSIDPRLARRQVRDHATEDEPLPRVWSNCSGKHAAMLAASVALGAPVETYLDPAHPVQVEITRIIASCAGLTTDDVGIGIDGCGAPAHEVPLDAMARSLWRLGRPDGLPADVADAARRVADGMTAHPQMVAGEGRFDTDLMRSSSVRILAKAGAEGVHGLAVPEHGLGLAVKVDDGSDRGYRQVVIELLARAGVLSGEEAEGLRQRHGKTIRNLTGTEVGHLEVVV